MKFKAKITRRNVLEILGVALSGASFYFFFGRKFMSKIDNNNQDKMPVLFLGHGSPMNAIEENDFTKTLSELGKNLPIPKAIVCVSAHWMTKGTWVTHMKQPKTIHDFYGFPQPLFDVQYPAPGDSELADQIRALVSDPKIYADDTEWGLDHGTWSVLKHVYPKADIPILQLSMDMTQPIEFHYQMGEKLKKLREQGVLIVGSGNIVHNLRKISWDENAPPHPLTVEFDQWVKQKIDQRDDKALFSDALNSEAGKFSAPTPDHYFPLLYILGASDKSDKIEYIYEGYQNSSISMRCVRFG